MSHNTGFEEHSEIWIIAISRSDYYDFALY